MSAILHRRGHSRGSATFSAMNAESSPRQGAKTSIWDAGTADFAAAVVARLYSVKGDIDFLKGAPLPIQIGQDEIAGTRHTDFLEGAKGQSGDVVDRLRARFAAATP